MAVRHQNGTAVVVSRRRAAIHGRAAVRVPHGRGNSARERDGASEQTGERSMAVAAFYRAGRGSWESPVERERKSAINDGGRVNRETTEHGRGSDRGGLRVPRSREESRRRLGSRRRRSGGVEAGAGADGVRKLQNNCWSLRMLLTGGPTCKSHRMEWREADWAHAP